MHKRAMNPEAKTKQLLVYDISDKKRLQKCHRLCQQKAVSLQNSTFMFQGTVQAFNELIESLQPLIDEEEDAFWTFDVSPNAYHCQIGAPAFVTGLTMEGSLCQRDLII